jgi:hypothetical protein
MANNMQSSVHLMKQLRAYGTLVPLGTAALHAGVIRLNGDLRVYILTGAGGIGLGILGGAGLSN